LKARVKCGQREGRHPAKCLPYAKVAYSISATAQKSGGLITIMLCRLLMMIGVMPILPFGIFTSSEKYQNEKYQNG
jgi:hypothetical protein